MASRNFDEEFKLTEREGHTFTLGGMEFHTKGYMSPEPFINRQRGIYAAVQLILACLIPSERDVFNKLMEDMDAPVSMKQVDVIADWLFEIESDRPTIEPSTSGAGDAAPSAS